MSVIESVDTSVFCGVRYDVIDLASRGLPSAEIGDFIGHSSEVVDDYRHEIIRKLGAANMSQAVSIGCEAGMLDEVIDPVFASGTLIKPEYHEVLELTSQGYSAEQIAILKGLSKKAVHSRRDRMRLTLQSRTLPHAVRIGFQTGLLPVAGEV